MLIPNKASSKTPLYYLCNQNLFQATNHALICSFSSPIMNTIISCDHSVPGHCYGQFFIGQPGVS